MFGPEYTTIGSPTYLTNNRLSKGNGGHHLNDSNISDNGTTVSISTPLVVTGSINATSFTGSLLGTASRAVLAFTASNVISEGQTGGGNQYLLVSVTNPNGGDSLQVRTSNLVYDSTANRLPTTASWAGNATLATSASFATNAANASSASFATNAANASSASFATSASYAVSSSNSVTSSFAVTASYALNAGSGGVTGGEVYSYTFLLMGS
jgi:hypothetical protein